ncbi:hypothetical protein VSK91_19870 [Bacillus swezeyi]|uniref:hypothetical protein n=1 Tax=Bacillus swezeyi TaxID=1925020 RepID=UPI0039C62C76
MRPLVKYLSVLGAIVVLGGGIVIYNVLHNTDKESDDNASSENTSEENTNDVTNVYSSESTETAGDDENGMTPDKFEQRFNKVMKKLFGENPTFISLKHNDGDELDYFSYEFDESLVLVGGADKTTNKITNLILTKRDELEGDSYKNYLKAVGVMMKVFNPYMTTNDIKSMINDKLDLENVINKHEVKSLKVESETYNSLRYSFNYSNDKLGLLFTISISKE